MTEDTGFRTEPMERVIEGMTVVDAAGEKLGTVAYVKLGDSQAVTTQGNEPGELGVLGAVPSPASGEREPDVPEPLRSQLLRAGFIKVDGPGLLDPDRYVRGDRVGDVSGDTVRLRPPTSSTARPRGAIVETQGEVSARADAPAAGQLPTAGPGATVSPFQQPSRGLSRGVMFGVGGGGLAAIGGAGGAAWLYRRWQRERNRPINRLRRQVRRAAAKPAWPTGGLGVALVLALLLGRGLRAWVSPDNVPARAADRLRKMRRAEQATAREEVRPRPGKIQLPRINLPSVSRVASGPTLVAARARARSVPPSAGRTGLGLGGLLALGAAGYLGWRTLRGRGRGIGTTEPASAFDQRHRSAGVPGDLPRFLPGGRGVRQPGPRGEELPQKKDDPRREAARRLDWREEELQARKEPVQTGEVQIGKEVVSEEKTIEVPRTHEEVTVERRPVERRPADRPIGEGETISVPVHEERVSVEKAPVVYEELEVGTRQAQETEQVSGEVRRDEARIEREGDVDVRGDEPRRSR